jgi:hypothetical protein
MFQGGASLNKVIPLKKVKVQISIEVSIGEVFKISDVPRSFLRE